MSPSAFYSAVIHVILYVTMGGGGGGMRGGVGGRWSFVSPSALPSCSYPCHIICNLGLLLLTRFNFNPRRD